ncbi:OLC1v1015869C1 [Oldenlandia corymbosa var. corymbosa]|uniref:OLC1v1015869C1 n=1 Tax=Oldenlandia corymbosa var. corymbosa TaxID=529605 RepID=A0AAV1E4L0_OLDCO|nr:OLC1v1015869C1 [Oldenlandia corymbosa var. corymbosa]
MDHANSNHDSAYAPSATTAFLYFPANDDNDGEDSNTTASSQPLHSSPKLPPRLRRRLLEPKSSSPSTTAEDIENKLRHAQLRREQFYELLVSRARPKSRSSGWSTLQEEGLGQRLEAKLYAAKQKRLSILASIRKRLSRINELRQAAKNGLELRLDKEREALGVKIVSRVQKAEANRMLLLRARKQRKMAEKERIVQSLMKRTIQEKKYKELVWARIRCKRAAAEKKRLGVLEAQKSRAREVVLQAHCKAFAVKNKQMIESGVRKKQLEAKLLRAKRLRMELLSRRAKLRCSANSPSGLVDPALLAKKLARCWRQFVRDKGTTLCLAKAYAALEINEKAVKSMMFEQLASKIESSATIRTAKAFLDRLELRIKIKQEVDHADNQFRMERIDHLLKHVISPGKINVRRTEKTGSRNIIRSQVKLSRYPVRVVFCAYMILGHPDAVFSGRGEYEIPLAKSAKSFVEEFELLIRNLLQGPRVSSLEEMSSPGSRLSFYSLLEKFDKAWCIYLKSFVAWKVHDAKLLEEDLVRAARQLEHNIMQSQQQATEDSGYPEGRIMVNCDKVIENDKFVAENVQQLDALVSVYSSEGATISDPREAATEVRPGFQKSSVDEFLSALNGQVIENHVPQGAAAVADNEVLVNEIVHGHKRSLFDGYSITSEDKENVKKLIRDAMEQAFWDGVLESIQQKEPDYSWVLKLMKEVRDELCALSPSSWSDEIVGMIDIDILSQVLKSGVVYMDYLKRILGFAMVTLQRLSAPANEAELKSTHQKLLEELNEISQATDFDTVFARLIIKGLQLVLQQIQKLKHDVSKARIAILEPVIKGPAGLEYLKSSFANRFGDPTDAAASLPLVMQWFSSMVEDYEKEWREYLDAISNLSLPGPSPSTLRTGGSILKEVKVGSLPTGSEELECKGEKVDLLLRLGLLRLVSEVDGLTVEKLPETLKLNLLRLRDVQSQLQKIIVISSSILVLRQTLLSEKLVTNSTEMENTVSKCVKDLSDLLDNSEDIGVSDVIEAMNCFSEGGDDIDRCQTRKELMARMLAKSLRAGDPIFMHVSRTVYLAARGVVLGGSGMKGKQLAETVLKRIGASLLTEKLVEAVEELVVTAIVSAKVHRPWYEQILVNI